jgi:mannose/fructose-specific phosphotransferase system component IIA
MRSLMITHGGLGQSLIECISEIRGECTGIDFIGNRDYSKSDLEQKIEDWLKEQPEIDACLFTDFPGSSCNNAARMVAARIEIPAGIYVLTGINMPMLMTFIQRRDQFKGQELVDYILDRGKKGIK